MTVYKNPQGTGIFVVFKYVDGDLDTGSYSGSYRYKPPARIYNTIGKAKAQHTRFHRDGYTARCAEVWIDSDGAPQIQFIDAEWIPPTERCLYQNKCLRRKDHAGIHWAGKEARDNPDFDPELAATQ